MFDVVEACRPFMPYCVQRCSSHVCLDACCLIGGRGLQAPHPIWYAEVVEASRFVVASVVAGWLLLLLIELLLLLLLLLLLSMEWLTFVKGALPIIGHL